MQKKTLLPFILVFIIVTLFAIGNVLFTLNWNIDSQLVAGANTILFLIGIFNVWQQSKSRANQNPHAMVRSVMSGTVLKLFVLGSAAFIYLYQSGEHKNVNGLFFSMALYIVYTWLDVRVALKENPVKKDGSN